MEAQPSYETSQNNAGAGNYGVGSGNHQHKAKHKIFRNESTKYISF